MTSECREVLVYVDVPRDVRDVFVDRLVDVDDDVWVDIDDFDRADDALVDAMDDAMDDALDDALDDSIDDTDG